MALYYSASSTQQVMPVGATDPGTYYISMQPVTNGRTNSHYAGANITYNASTGSLTLGTVNVNMLNVNAITVNGTTGAPGQFLTTSSSGLRYATPSAIANGLSNVTIGTTNGSITMGAGGGPGLTYDVSGNLTIGGNLIVLGTTTTVVNETAQGSITPSANLTYNLGSTTAWFNNIYGASGNFNTININSGGIIPGSNLTVNLGSTTAWFNNIYGTAVHALYADLAENYQADRFYMPGTVVQFGGAAEVTQAEADTTRVAGVISTNPATLMNAALNGANVVAVALTGRVPCMVVGPVAKGDIMVSAGFGYARVNNTPAPGQAIGKALEDFVSQAKGVIEVVVGKI